MVVALRPIYGKAVDVAPFCPGELELKGEVRCHVFGTRSLPFLQYAYPDKPGNEFLGTQPRPYPIKDREKHNGATVVG